MGQVDWKKELTNHFENVRVIELSQAETVAQFDQFCEFIAEPAFEALAEEMKSYKIRSKFWTQKGSSTGIRFDFPGGGVESFQYVILLTMNAVQLKLRLQLKGKKSSKAPLDESEEAFMDRVPPDRVLLIIPFQGSNRTIPLFGFSFNRNCNRKIRKLPSGILLVHWVA